MAGSRRSRSSGRSSKSRYRWFDSLLENGALSATGGTQLGSVMFNSTVAVENGLSLVRIVGDMYFSLTGSETGTYVVTSGLAVVHDDAVAALALPDPRTDTRFLWMNQMVMDISTFTGGGSPTTQLIHIDSKSRRRIREEDQILMIHEIQASGNPGVMRVDFNLRTLMRLP